MICSPCRDRTHSLCVVEQRRDAQVSAGIEPVFAQLRTWCDCMHKSVTGPGTTPQGQ